MDKTLYCWWIITADIAKLRNYIRLVQQQHQDQKIKNMFPRIGIPEIVKSDNGPYYNSREFKRFPIDQGFQHITSSPDYPVYDLGEKKVQTAKKQKPSGGNKRG